MSGRRPEAAAQGNAEREYHLATASRAKASYLRMRIMPRSGVRVEVMQWRSGPQLQKR